MNKEIIIKNAKKRFKGALQKKVIKQIDNFFDILNSDYVVKSDYKIGDNVILNKNHLLHGIGKHIDVIDIIAKRGVVSLDYLGDNSNHGVCYVAAFWKVSQEILLGEFINNYSGMIAKVNDKYEQIPYKQLDNFVEKMKDVDHWLWTAESSMEIRFMPSLARNINQIGFILNVNDEKGKKLRENAVFNNNFSEKENFQFTSKKSRNNFKKTKFQNDFFSRAEYIIFGVPSNYIEGVLVGRDVEKDNEMLSKIQELLPNCYICNLDGKVIKKANVLIEKLNFKKTNIIIKETYIDENGHEREREKNIKIPTFDNINESLEKNKN